MALPTPRLPRRAGRRTNVGLLALLLVAGGTGVLAFAVGSPGPAALVVAVHGAAGLGLLLLVPWKAVVVRRAWRRPTSSGGVSLGIAALLTPVTGLLHAAGGTGPWSWSAGVPVLHAHVAAGVATGVLVVVHTWGRRQRPRATDLDRRGLLLATHAAGRPLTSGHGPPVRPVAPGRRGSRWVEWVARLEVVDGPWWLQSPFPLQ